MRKNSVRTYNDTERKESNMNRTTREINEIVHDVLRESKIQAAQDAGRAPEIAEHDEILENILHIAEQLPEKESFAFLIKIIRPILQESEPEERRQICDALAEIQPKYDGKETGRFFIAIASANCPVKPDPEELGRRIMEKRNPNYQPKGKK